MAVRLTGYLWDPSGMGVASRVHLSALLAVGARVTARSVGHDELGPTDVPLAPDDPLAHATTSSVPVQAVIVNTQPEVFPSFVEAGRLNIGLTACETTRLKPELARPVRMMDAIWVPSAFSAEGFQALTDRPVRVIPHPMPIPEDHGARGRLPGIPDDVFLFASVFDWSDRKNPLGMARAFHAAFSGRRDVALLLKVRSSFGQTREAILGALRGVIPRWRRHPRIYVIFEDLRPSGVAAIYRRADAYLSLHRAEGYGLSMAEAMARGLPVVATGYSGNLEFMDQRSAFLVDHRIVPARQELFQHPAFDPSMTWAEPDLDSAVAALRAVAGDPALRERIARAGQARVRTELSLEQAGARMVAALRELGVDALSESDPTAPPAEPAPTAPPETEARRVFEQIYATNHWFQGSGAGSSPEMTAPYRALLQELLQARGVRTVLDIGCGDWQSSQLIDWRGVDYTGLDVVPSLIEENTARYGSANVRFELLDILAERARFRREADLIILKDVLQHWPNHLVLEVVDLLRPRCRWLLLSNCCDQERDWDDIPLGGFRPLSHARYPLRLFPAELLGTWSTKELVVLAGGLAGR